MYKIEIDFPQRLIDLKIWGFWSDQDFEDFAVDMQRAAHQVGHGQNNYICLCDATELKVMHQPLAERYANFLTAPGIAARQSAVIAESPLLIMQIRRVTADMNVAVFQSMDEARAWLNLPNI
jgi:hypothetical protein